MSEESERTMGETFQGSFEDNEVDEEDKELAKGENVSSRTCGEGSQEAQGTPRKAQNPKGQHERKEAPHPHPHKTDCQSDIRRSCNWQCQWTWLRGGVCAKLRPWRLIRDTAEGILGSPVPFPSQASRTQPQTNSSSSREVNRLTEVSGV